MKYSWVYILKCSDGSYYTGCTSNLDQRIEDHVHRRFDGYTSSRLPITLVFSQQFTDIHDAIRAERQIKNWPRQKKEALIKGDFKLLHELAKCTNQTHFSYGDHPSTPLRVTSGIDRLNLMDNEIARSELVRCCGSSRWVMGMIQRRPFSDAESLFASADEIWRDLSIDDWTEAFSHHPKIGDINALRVKFASTRTWAEGEQAGASNASEQILLAFAAGNAAYEQKFGYIFIVCATGKTAEEMLTLLKQRLGNDPKAEIRVAAEEQRKITLLRLEKLIGEPHDHD
ncbi:MAG: decarboxylase [Bacteroidetes bacterium]|nr:decarboxylase [Bacteroidota bacterium]